MLVAVAAMFNNSDSPLATTPDFFPVLSELYLNEKTWYTSGVSSMFGFEAFWKCESWPKISDLFYTLLINMSFMDYVCMQQMNFEIRIELWHTKTGI